MIIHLHYLKTFCMHMDGDIKGVSSASPFMLSEVKFSLWHLVKKMESPGVSKRKGIFRVFFFTLIMIIIFKPFYSLMLVLLSILKITIYWNLCISFHGHNFRLYVWYFFYFMKMQCFFLFCCPLCFVPQSFGSLLNI